MLQSPIHAPRISVLGVDSQNAEEHCSDPQKAHPCVEWPGLNPCCCDVAPCSIALCMCTQAFPIMGKFDQIWGSQLPHQTSQENHTSERHSFGTSTTIGILKCNPWAAGLLGRVQKGLYIRLFICEKRAKCKNWRFLTPRISETVRRTKKLTKMGNSLALGPQRRMNGISLQCVHWAVGWSE